MLRLQVRTICCRDSDEDFLLAKSDRSPIARKVHMGLSARGVRFHEESGGRSVGGGLRMVLGRLVYWRSLRNPEAIGRCRNPAAGAHPLQKLIQNVSTVEVWMESGSCRSSSEIHPLWKFGWSSVLARGQ